MNNTVRFVPHTLHVTDQGCQTDSSEIDNMRSTKEATRCIVRNFVETTKQLIINWVLPAVTVGAITGMTAAWLNKEGVSTEIAQKGFIAGTALTLTAKIAFKYFNQAPQQA